MFAEGQKKATYEVWNGKEKKTTETIAELKKEIKDLSGRLINYINVAEGKYSSDEIGETIRTINYPNGADTAQKAFEIYDLQLINQIKQYDLLEAQFVQRKNYREKLLQEKAELASYQHDCDENQKSSKSLFKSNQPPITVEEDKNRKLVCHLENEIIRINVQWSQAEHICKKYKAIKGSLMNDAEKFEKNLLEIENALSQQNTDIENMKVNLV